MADKIIEVRQYHRYVQTYHVVITDEEIDETYEDKPASAGTNPLERSTIAMALAISKVQEGSEESVTEVGEPEYHEVDDESSCPWDSVLESSALSGEDAEEIITSICSMDDGRVVGISGAEELKRKRAHA